MYPLWFKIMPGKLDTSGMEWDLRSFAFPLPNLESDMSAIEDSVEVNVPVQVAYQQWSRFEDFPQFMDGVEEVKQLDERHLHWRAEIAGKEKEWDAEITQNIPGKCIAWRSTAGAENAGEVNFDAIGDSTTRVSVRMQYETEGVLESVGDAAGVLKRKVGADLERFKRFVEARA
jgi:uncharacterized membrane protein